MSNIDLHKAIIEKAVKYFSYRYDYNGRLGPRWPWNRKCCGKRMYSVYMYSTEPENEHCSVHKTTKQVYRKKAQVCGCPTCDNVLYFEPCPY